MTLTEAAAKLQRSDMTLRRWIKKGLMEGKRHGYMWDIPESEIERLLRHDYNFRSMQNVPIKIKQT